MASKIDPETAVAYLKIVIALSFAWPFPKNTNRFSVIRFIIIRVFFFVNSVLLSLFSLHTIYSLSLSEFITNDSYELPKIMKLSCLVAALIQIPLQMIQCALQFKRLQYVTSEMENKFKNAEPHESIIYQQYIDRCIAFHASNISVVFFTALGLTVIVPLIMADQTFPLDVKYTFNVDREPLKSVLFLHQALGIWQCFSTVSYGNFIGLLIWFCAARFEILSEQFRAVNCTKDFIACIRQHFELLRYTQDVIIAVRALLFSIIFICSWAILCSGLTIVIKSTLAEKGQFVMTCVTILLEVFACAWPADYLIDASTNVARAVYESPWYNQNLPLQRSLLFVLTSSQTPIAVSVSAILPTLSLNYYASFISTSFSYLMTLRIVFDGKAE